MRIELRDGQWAEMLDHITHGKDKQIRRDRARLLGSPETEWDWPDVLLRAFVTSWQVNDSTGSLIPWTDADALDRAPDDIVDDLFAQAAKNWVHATLPNSPTPPSSDG